MGMIDHRHCARTFCAVLVAVVCFCTPAATHACSEYQHVWQTVGENSTAELTPQVLTVFLELVARHLPDPPASWGLTIVGLPPTAATTTTDLIAQLRPPDSIATAPLLQWQWQPDIAMFSWSAVASAPWLPAGLAGIVFLDAVEPRRTEFCWVDHGGAPFAMFRLGVLEALRARVLAVDGSGTVRFIDELTTQTVTAIDLMTPVTPLVGGLWLRRVSRTRPPLPRTREWLLSPPPIVGEAIFSMPVDQERWYWGATQPVTAPTVKP